MVAATMPVRGADDVVVAFAGFSFAVTGLAPHEADALRARFPRVAPSASHTTPDATLSMRALPRGCLPAHDTRGLQESLALTPRDHGVHVQARVFLADVDDDGGVCVAIDDALVDTAQCIGVVENVLRVVVARLCLARGGLLLHSAAIAGDDAGCIVLVGRSGAGKSTSSAAALQQGHRVLSDELNAVFMRDGVLVAVPVPFAGDFAEAPQHQALRLRRILLLEQGENGVRNVSRARAVSALVGAAPFVNADPRLLDVLFARAEELAAAGNIGALSLRKGADPWQVAIA